MATSGSRNKPATGSGASRRSAWSPNSAWALPLARHLPASLPAPMATYGLRSKRATGSGNYAAGRGHRIRRRHYPWRGTYWHRRRPGWQPVVHGARRQPDRADHAAGRRDRIQHRHHRGREPDSITAGPDGNLWFTEIGTATGSDASPRRASSPSSAPASSADAAPIGITAGPDGNLWFTEYSGNRIGRITPLGVVTEFSAGLTASAAPIGITAGPDGNLWFTEQSGNRIGRITPLGVITEFSAGISAVATPIGITAGPDGNLWFTEIDGNRIGAHRHFRRSGRGVAQGARHGRNVRPAAVARGEQPDGRATTGDRPQPS